MAIRNWIIIALLLIAASAVAIYFAAQKTYVFRFTDEELQKRLSERMPFTKAYLAIFEVTLDEPRVDLIEESDRVAAGIDVLLNMKIGSAEVPLGGSVDMEGGVKYDPAKAEFFLTDAKILDLRLQGVPDRYMERAHDAVAYALNEYYKTRPIYSLKDTSAAEVAAKLVLRDITVKDEQLVVTLGLAKNGAQAQQ